MSPRSTAPTSVSPGTPACVSARSTTTENSPPARRADRFRLRRRAPGPGARGSVRIPGGAGPGRAARDRCTRRNRFTRWGGRRTRSGSRRSRRRG
ncbi:hypothetical protein FM076_31215 [Streptomyces albus subsp. chlorinus]|nr:hypothetical protein [Streptomyces albus subsp. chlorinus]